MTLRGDQVRLFCYTVWDVRFPARKPVGADFVVLVKPDRVFRPEGIVTSVPCELVKYHGGAREEPVKLRVYKDVESLIQANDLDIHRPTWSLPFGLQHTMHEGLVIRLTLRSLSDAETVDHVKLWGLTTELR